MLEGQGEVSRCPFHHETQESWVLGAHLGFGSGGGCRVGGLGIGPGLSTGGVFRSWEDGQGLGGRQGAVRGRAKSDRSQEWSPTHPEGHLNSPVKDSPHLSVSEVASLSRRGLAGGHRSVRMLGMSQARGLGVGRVGRTGEIQMSQEGCLNS